MTHYQVFSLHSEHCEEPPILKATMHIVKCDLVKEFNQLVRSGLVGGLYNIPLQFHPIKEFTYDC